MKEKIKKIFKAFAITCTIGILSANVYLAEQEIPGMSCSDICEENNYRICIYVVSMGFCRGNLR